jgi:hypothetical protein
MLLREEMRRVLRYLTWEAGWWEGQADLRTDVDSALQSGLRGYAAKQARWRLRLRDYFRQKWDILVLAAAQHLVAVDGADGLELDQFFTQHV